MTGGSCLLQLLLQCPFKVNGIFPQACLHFMHLNSLYTSSVAPWLLLKYDVKRKQAKQRQTKLFRTLFLTAPTVAPVTSELLSQWKKRKYSLRLGSFVASATRVCGGENVPRLRGGGQLSGRSTVFYESADAGAQEHVVLIGSRARPRPPLKHQSAMMVGESKQREPHGRSKKKKPKPQTSPGRCSVAVLSWGSSVPRLINNHSVFIQLFPPRGTRCCLRTQKPVHFLPSQHRGAFFFFSESVRENATLLLDMWSLLLLAQQLWRNCALLLTIFYISTRAPVFPQRCCWHYRKKTTHLTSG